MFHVFYVQKFSVEKFMKIVTDMKYSRIVMFLMLRLGFHVKVNFTKMNFYTQLLHHVVSIPLSKLPVSTDEINTESKE